MTRLIALLIVLAFAVTSGVIPVLAQPKEPATKSDKASASTKKELLDINSASAEDLKALQGPMLAAHLGLRVDAQPASRPR